MLTIEQLQEAQLKVHPESIFVSPTELRRLIEKHLSGASVWHHTRTVDDICFKHDFQCYVIPRKGKNERPWFGVRTGLAAGDYHSFS